jgi:hypothetical protein
MITGSPSLEVVSKTAESEIHSSERRRLPRLSLSTEQFRLDQTGKIFSVNNLSEGGMALRILDERDFLLFPIAAVASGILNLHGTKWNVTAKVARLGTDEVGFEFTALKPEVSQAVKTFLDPARLGAELKPIPSSEKGPLWYHGPSGTDLLLWRGVDGQYHKLLLLVLGSFVQWDAESPSAALTTGDFEMSQQNSETWGVVRFETMLLQADAQLDRGKLSIAKNLLVSSNLPQDLKKWCLRQIEWQP